MSDALTTEKDNDPVKLFQKKIQDRLRDEIGTLMPDEMFTKIIENAIKAELYRDITPPGNRSSWNHTPQPWLQDTINTLVKTRIEETVAKIITEKSDDFEKIITEQIKEQFPNMVAKFFIGLVGDVSKGMGQAISMNMMNSMNNR